MSLSMPLFADGTVIQAADLISRADDIEKFLNRGIVSTDLKTTSKWVDSLIIFKPDFFGSPAPRTEFVSGDTHYRLKEDVLQQAAVFHGDQLVDTWLPVWGLAATVRNHMSVSVRATVSASFYAFTIFGTNTYNLYQQKTAEFALFSGEAFQTGTRRSIYAVPGAGAADEYAVISRENIGIVGMPSLAPGTNHLSIRIKLEPTTFVGAAPHEEPRWKHTFVVPRTFVVDVHALG